MMLSTACGSLLDLSLESVHRIIFVCPVIQVNNVLGFERTIGGLARLGSLEVTCCPIIGYENFAQNLGKSTEEFLQAWKREAEFVMGARTKDGFPIELFKVVGERKVHSFLQVNDPVQLDQLSFQLPIVRENGQNVKLRSKAIQYLPDYCQRIFSESL
nr:hypothetical protein BaRGS_012547 [Batillaria attramentaria]